MRLLVVRGPQRVGPFDLRPGANVVGRGTDCAIVLPSRRVSRRHAVIQVEGERVVARDLESHNGLIDADGRRVAVVPMPPGSRVQVGDFLLMLEAPMAPVDDDLDLDEEEKSEISLDPEDTAESELPPPTGPFPSRTEVPSAAPGNGASPPPPPATPTATPRPELPRPAPRPSPDSGERLLAFLPPPPPPDRTPRPTPHLLPPPPNPASAPPPLLRPTAPSLPPPSIAPAPSPTRAAPPAAAERSTWPTWAALVVAVGLWVFAPLGGVVALVSAGREAAVAAGVAEGVLEVERLAAAGARETTAEGARQLLRANADGVVVSPPERLRTSVATNPAVVALKAAGRPSPADNGDGTWDVAAQTPDGGLVVLTWDPAPAADAHFPSGARGLAAGAVALAGAVVLAFGSWWASRDTRSA